MLCFKLISIVFTASVGLSLTVADDQQYCTARTESCGHTDTVNVDRSERSAKRFIIYDHNFGEGFNLRRDIYIRMALLVRQLGAEWTLVLPKWSLVPHWRRRSDEPAVTQWKNYFDIDSLQQFIPVIEFDHFFANSVDIDVVLSLGHFADTFETSEWSERHELSECQRSKHFETIDSRIVYNYDNHLNIKSLFCLKIEGFIPTLKDIINDKFADAKNVFISNAEIIVNNEFGSKDYWSVRRSMRFSADLISVANQYRKEYLNSDDISDQTVVDSDWKSMKRSAGSAVGGPYLSVHLRRGDFARYRSQDVPDLECAVKQIEFALRTYAEFSDVFVASDANHTEWTAIENLLNPSNVRLFRFQSEDLSDGQSAVVEQWIASHARLFVGTYDSTFSFRIQEEREILGFPPNTTFNALCSECGQRLSLCKQEAQWRIVY